MKFKKKDLLNLVDDNKSIIFGVFVIIFVFSICLLPLLGKGTYSTGETEETTTDSLVMTCDETAVAQAEIECSIVLNSVTMTTQGISAKYNVSEGMEYVGFVADTSWSTYDETNYSDSEGFVLVSDGVTGSVNVGIVTFKIPDTAVSNENYTVELVDATIGDGDSVTVAFENVSDSVRILSDVNTLEGITLSDGTLNETFDRDKKEYTATVDSDKVTIETILTDPNSSVTDTSGELALHYGTNSFEVVVTSETGKENIYTLDIYRKYNFSSETYIYSKEDNYIYTGTDINKETILNNITLPDDLNSDVDTENNKLIISYEEEKLLEIDILNISFNKYNLEEKNLYIDKDLSYDNFVANITKSDDISLKVFNANEEVTASEEIMIDGMVLKMYDKNDKELDTFNIKIYSLKFDESLNIDEENKYIKYLVEETTVSELIDKVIVVGGSVKLYDSNGDEKTDSDVLATGDVLTVYLNDETKDKYTLSVIGDSSGDGFVDLIDLAHMRKHIVGWVNPNTNEIQRKTGVYYYALDFNKDGIIDLIDLAKMRKTIVGLI